ncbi:hypothetical protein [Virgibacillus sp. YIM 98842]|uniref:hypothetical protein n=1 Tax=Virgibacillus sp. YIM 98842 TaxID=2663533 RepID=UPI0013DB92DE|nr:hypothetical protein [Virgibacillus sp. YIM 98842]
MNYYYTPVYWGKYYNQPVPYDPNQMRRWPADTALQPNERNLHGLKAKYENGNICAFVPDEDASYSQLSISQWPSQDYHYPHPKGFLHTDLTKEHGAYYPQR